jgi:CRP-like cAMP-binding protein
MSGVNLDAWVLKMRARDPTLSSEENEVLRDSVKEVVQIEADRDIVREQDRCDQSHLLLRGWACRYLTLADGRRQILSFHIAGDVLDLQCAFLDLDFDVCALTRCQVAPVAKAKLRQLLDTNQRLSDAVWQSSLVEAATTREWLVGMGRKTARAQVAHLLCEIYVRQQAVGLTRGPKCVFPMTQNHLADALGLSAVHTNRVLQGLRASRLIALAGGELTVRDWAGLCATAEFDAAYLHLPQRSFE